MAAGVVPVRLCCDGPVICVYKQVRRLGFPSGRGAECWWEQKKLGGRQNNNTTRPYYSFIYLFRERETKREEKRNKREEKKDCTPHRITLVCVVQSSRLLGNWCHASYMPSWHARTRLMRPVKLRVCKVRHTHKSLFQLDWDKQVEPAGLR